MTIPAGPPAPISEPPLRFNRVNVRGQPGYRPGWQRHHLLPRQLLGVPAFRTMFAALRPRGFWIDDFRANGVLLPASEPMALRHWLPMHRGPHRVYSEMVMDRVGAVEASWIEERGAGDRRADGNAMFRLGLIQKALTRRLGSTEIPPIRLNRKDPIGTGVDFSNLDTMAELLWEETGADEDEVRD